MSNLAKLEFVVLDISSKNYLSWVLDAEIHLDVMNLGNIIKEGNDASLQDRVRTLIFLRHHIDEGLKMWYERTLATYLSYFKALVDLYQASIKAKGNKVEINFIDSDGPVDLTHLNVLDFFENPNGKINHLIGDENIIHDASYYQNSFEHPLKNQKILMPNYYNYVACSQGKLIIRPSFTKVEYESPTFLERIQALPQPSKLGHQHQLGGGKSIPEEWRDITWYESSLSHLDPSMNAPTHINVPEGQLENVIASESKTHLKRVKPIGSKDSLSTLEEFTNMKWSNDETQLDKQTEEISMSHTRETKNHSDIIIDYIFAFQVAMDIMRNDEDQKPQTVDECQKMNDWPKWKEAIQTELKSLAKQEVFGPINDEIIRYKAQLVAQGFSQRPGIDYEETYSPIMDTIIFQYLISLIVSEGLDMCLMDVVTTYLYGSIDTNIYIKIPE
ncbi:hypothetical protein AAG906_032841 [Vitis piasezkii]